MTKWESDPMIFLFPADIMKQFHNHDRETQKKQNLVLREILFLCGLIHLSGTPTAH
jgi:hypothetical protein